MKMLIAYPCAKATHVGFTHRQNVFILKIGITILMLIYTFMQNVQLCYLRYHSHKLIFRSQSSVQCKTYPICLFT